jgi:uncharacterized membrane protein YfcA
MIIIGGLLGFLVGLALGILGGGGSILTVPIFVYILGFEARDAIAMSLFVVGLTSVAGAVSHWRHGNVDLRTALLFGAFAMTGTFGGARLAVFFSGAAQLTLFAVVMLVAAVFMFRGSAAHVDAPAVPEIDLARGVLIGVEGIAVGVLTGLVGVGGGFLIVPALVLLGGVSIRQAVGTSLVIISAKSAAGFVGYLDQVQVRWMFMLTFSAVATAGILVGSRLVRHIPATALRRAFAVFLAVMGVLILYQNRTLFLEL